MKWNHLTAWYCTWLYKKQFQLCVQWLKKLHTCVKTCRAYFLSNLHIK